MDAVFKTVQTFASTTEIDDNSPSQIGHLLFYSLGFHETIEIAQFFSAMVWRRHAHACWQCSGTRNCSEVEEQRLTTTVPWYSRSSPARTVLLKYRQDDEGGEEPADSRSPLRWLPFSPFSSVCEVCECTAILLLLPFRLSLLLFLVELQDDGAARGAWTFSFRAGHLFFWSILSVVPGCAAWSGKPRPAATRTTTQAAAGAAAPATIFHSNRTTAPLLRPAVTKPALVRPSVMGLFHLVLLLRVFRVRILVVIFLVVPSADDSAPLRHDDAERHLLSFVKWIALPQDAVFLIAILAICSAPASPKICSTCRAGNTLVLRQFVKLHKLLAAGG